jgi:hypothetical protein
MRVIEDARKHIEQPSGMLQLDSADVRLYFGRFARMNEKAMASGDWHAVLP